MRNLISEVIELLESDEYLEVPLRISNETAPILFPYMYRIWYKPRIQWENGIEVLGSLDFAKTRLQKHVSESREDLKFEMLLSGMNSRLGELFVQIPIDKVLNEPIEVVEFEGHREILNKVRQWLDEMKSNI